MDYLKMEETVCRSETDSAAEYRNKLPEITDRIIENCLDEDNFTHIDYEPLPSKEAVVEIIKRAMEILYPGYFNREKIDPLNLKYNLGQSISILFDMVTEQTIRSLRHECFRYNKPCEGCIEKAHEITTTIFDLVPALKKILATDVRAAFDGDPAAKSYDEVIFSYPGLFAISVYRIAHKLYELEVPLLPRMMTEHAHSITGIDIHPGANIGKSFAIDHGTGIVIGETTVIGNNVRIYQGVTLGALSLPKDAGTRLKGIKRHPTIEDDVIIYSGATILGGTTTIGARSTIGGNVWLTNSIPQDTKVMMEEPKLIYK
jgi:serine O-acetyltransferase